EAHAAQGPDAVEQGPRGPRRVDEDVALRPPDEVARGAVGGLGRVAAVVDVVVDPLGEGMGGPPGVGARQAPDGGGGAGHEGHERPVAVGLGPGLGRHDRLARGLVAPEHGRRDLPAGLAVDAAPVDVEVALGILDQAFGEPRHRPESCHVRRRRELIRRGPSRNVPRSDMFPRLAALPPYVLATVDELKSKLRAAGHDVYDFGLGNPDGPSPTAALERLATESRRAGNQRYMPSRGLPEVRAAICDWYRRRY